MQPNQSQPILKKMENMERLSILTLLLERKTIVSLNPTNFYLLKGKGWRDGGDSLIFKRKIKLVTYLWDIITYHVTLQLYEGIITVDW